MKPRPRSRRCRKTKAAAGSRRSARPIAVLRETAKLGDAAQIQARLDADPADHQARFDLALLQNANGDRHAAADSLLSIVKADRTWQDDGARNQLIKFFEAWGMTDEATLAARRKLSIAAVLLSAMPRLTRLRLARECSR